MFPSLTHPRSPLRLIPVIYIGECLSAVVADKQASNSSIDQGSGKRRAAMSYPRDERTDHSVLKSCAAVPMRYSANNRQNRFKIGDCTATLQKIQLVLFVWSLHATQLPNRI
jgi:hypothetical protein